MYHRTNSGMSRSCLTKLLMDQARFCVGSAGSRQGVEAPILVKSVDVSFRVR